METDTKFFEIFQSHPEWILDIMNQSFTGKATFDSITTKRVELRMDGVWKSDDANMPIFSVEFQFYRPKNRIYSNIAEKVLALERRYPERVVTGVIFFANPGLDTQESPWRPAIRRFYLDKEMRRLARRDPSHPLPKLLAPVFEKSDTKLEKQAKGIYDAIQNVPNTTPTQVQTLCEVFYSLLLGRFKTKTHKQLAAMLNLPDITKTRAGRELIQIGKAETLLKILGKRLGSLPVEISEHVGQLDYLQLEKLEDQVLDIPSVKSLRAFLKSLRL